MQKCTIARHRLGVVFLALAGCGSVQASIITYTMTGNATGDFDGTVFVDVPFRIVVTGDTTARTGVAPTFTLNAISATVEIEGFALASFTNLTRMFISAPGCCWTFNEIGTLFIGTADPITGWDLISPIGPLGFDLFIFDPQFGTQFNVIPTSGGPLTITSETNGSMTATLDSVPEPSTFGLTGSSVIGLMLLVARRRMAGYAAARKCPQWRSTSRVTRA